MLIELKQLRRALVYCLEGAGKQGKAVQGLEQVLHDTPDSYDALAAFARRVHELPQRDDWPYEEPDDFDSIRAAWSPAAAQDGERPADAPERIREAFLARVCGCMLGKPVEVDPTLAELKAAGEKNGEWPIRDYVTHAFMQSLGRSHECVPVGVRGKLVRAIPDDDINYTVLAMRLLEEHGPGFTRDQQRVLWNTNLAPLLTYGPERTFMAKSTLRALDEELDRGSSPDYADWLNRLNPGAELCGALIRVDAYAYAAAGQPALAAELAWKDSSLTHVRTGVYSSMYVAAAIALAATHADPMDVMEKALAYVPQKSRFAEITRDCLAGVAAADDWESAYQALRAKYGTYTHCQIYLEVGTLINTLRFARDPGDAICLQVMQGNDTDSFGATAGSLSGMLHGPGSLDSRWLKPLNNEIYTSLSEFYQTDLQALAQRMGRLRAQSL